MLSDTTADTISGQFAAGSDGCGGKGEGTPLPVSPGGEAGGTPAVSIRVGGKYYPARLAPQLDLLPDWRNDEAFKALYNSAVRDRKFQTPVLGKLICLDPQTKPMWIFEIREGRHRYWAAGDAGLEAIDGAETDMPTSELMVRSLLERRHLGDSARALLAWPVIAPVVDANKAARTARHMENLKRINAGKKGELTESLSSSVQCPASLESIANDRVSEATLKSMHALAESYGINKTLLEQARKVHEIFTLRPDYKEEYYPRIIEGELRLGHFLAGFGGKIATEGKEKRNAPPDKLLMKSFTELRVRFAGDRWDAIPAETRPAVITAAIETVVEWPAEVLKAIALNINARIAAKP